MPRRVQLSRRSGWRKPAGAVVVARPSRWGNPFTIGPERSGADAVRQFEDALIAGDLGFSVRDVQTGLAGRDLACWCRLDEPCHADVLLRIAAQDPPVSAGDHDPPCAAPAVDGRPVYRPRPPGRRSR